MIKKLHFKALLLMATLVFGVGNVWGAEASFAPSIFSGQGTSGTGSAISGTVDGVTFACNKGYGNGTQIRCYSGGKITVSSSNTITAISFTFSGSYTGGMEESYTGLSTNSWTKELSSQARITAITVTYVPAHTITAISSNDAYGTVSLLGTTITASPNSGYRVVAGDGGYTVTNGTATVVNNGDNTFTVTPSSDCTVRINFEEIPTHKANFSVNGVVTPYDVQEGADIDFPADPANLGGKKFVGWAAAPISGTTDDKPTFVSSAKMGDENVTYYAVFATLTPGDAKTVDDELTRATTGITSTSYTSWSNKTATSDAVYAGRSAGGNDAIQLRTSDSNEGIVSTTSGGKIKKVVITWNINTSNGRKVQIYGSNTAYTGANQLYAQGTQGTLLGTLEYDTDTELDITGDYTYVGLRSASGALYLAKVAITWETGTPDAYSTYCTTVPSNVSLTITDAGFATYCSAYALDFSGVAGLTAYQAGMNGTTVEFTEVSDVPAETGVLVQGEKGTYNVPVVASSETKVDDNVLVGTVYGETIHANDADYFVLTKKNGNVGFYRVTATDYQVRANSAYLALAKGSVGNAKGFIPVDGTTAIDLVDTANEVAAPVYNLQGQKVNAAYKGVVIVNGKKVINK